MAWSFCAAAARVVSIAATLPSQPCSRASWSRSLRLAWISSSRGFCGKSHFRALAELAGDNRHGEGRAPLVDMMRRIKTEQADRIIIAALSDPEIPFQAMSALRRRFGNAAARPHIEPLLSSNHERVRNSAREHLKRIDKYLATHGN